MASKDRTPRLTRKQFLTGAGAGLGWLLFGCGRQTDLGKQAPPTEAPTATPAPTPTVSLESPATTAPPMEGAADMVFVNGKVITVDAADNIVQALAVQGNLIQAVGGSQDVQRLVGENTQVIDLDGRVLTPGLIDAHNHFQVNGLMNGYYLPLMPPEVRTIADLQARLREAVEQMPEGEWVQGYFLGLTEGRLPNRQDLDPVSPDHPIWIMQQGGHYGSANSLALQIADITADTPDPTGGVIERDAQGEPTGVFYNHRAMDLLRRHVPRYGPETVVANIMSTQPLFAACGVTSFQDNNVRGTDNVRAYMDTGRQGEMYLRGSVYYTLEWPSDLERALNEMEDYSDPYMRFAGYKFLLDGQTQMAYCHQPHNGVRWDTPTWDPQTFRETVRALHDTGLQICVHCAGDAAVDLTLDAFEQAMNANPRPDPRHRIEHCVLSTAEATQRIRDLGVVVSTQPQFIRVGGDHWAAVFGEERARRIMVTREWLENGVALALGSDAPTTPWITPQVTLAGAVSRLSISNQVFQPEQRLTIEESLRAHTMGSAYAAHEEHIKGSLEPGKLADLVVWSEDPTTATLQRLWQIPVDMTVVGGEVVYPAG